MKTRTLALLSIAAIALLAGCSSPDKWVTLAEGGGGFFGLGFFIPALFFFMVILLYIGWVGKRGDVELAPYLKARQDYKTSLVALSQDPSNSELNHRALQLGRQLARIKRPHGETIFDEMALHNDINAATSGKVEVQGTVETVPGQEPTKECQFCGGITLKRFIKCKHCGSDFE